MPDAAEVTRLAQRWRRRSVAQRGTFDVDVDDAIDVNAQRSKSTIVNREARDDEHDDGGDE